MLHKILGLLINWKVLFQMEMSQDYEQRIDKRRSLTKRPGRLTDSYAGAVRVHHDVMHDGVREDTQVPESLKPLMSKLDFQPLWITSPATM